jgi:hypothetical protein
VLFSKNLSIAPPPVERWENPERSPPFFIEDKVSPPPRIEKAQDSETFFKR